MAVIDLSTGGGPGDAQRPEDDKLKAFIRKDLAVRQAPFTSLAWTSDGEHLITGSDDGALKMFNLQKQVPVWQCDASKSSRVDLLAPNPATVHHLAVALSDKHNAQEHATIRHYDLRTSSSSSHKPESVDRMHSDALAIAWHPNGRHLGVSRKDGALGLYDVRKLGSKWKPTCPDRKLTWDLNNFAFTSGGGAIIGAYGEPGQGGLKVIKPSDLEEVAQYMAHTAPCVGLAIDAQDRFIACGGNDAIVTLWDAASMAVVKTFYGPDQPVNRTSFSFDQRYLAFTSNPTDANVTATVDVAVLDPSDIHRPSLIHRMPTPKDPNRVYNVVDLAWSPRHHVLAFCGDSERGGRFPLCLFSAPMGLSFN